MNSALKKIILIGGGLCAVGAASVGGLRFWLGKSLSKESLVSQMEKAWNCRAQIDDVKLVLAASPARLEITGCRIWLRDEEVGKPLGQRVAREPGPISIGTAVLEVKLEDLISKRLNVQQLTLSDVSVREDVDKEGNSSLGQIFEKPTATKMAASATAPTAAPEVVATPESAPPTEAQPAPEMAPMQEAETVAPTVQAPELGFAIRVDRASLQRAMFFINNRKNTTTTTLTDLSFSISEIDIDPADLAHHNSLKLLLDTQCVVRDHVTIAGEHKPVNLAELRLHGEGRVRPLDPATGLWSAATDLQVSLLKDSMLGGYMKLGDLDSKDLKKLDDYGLDLREISLGGALLEDAHIRVHFENDSIELMEDSKFVMVDYELAMGKGTWLTPPEDQHEFNLRISAGPKLQEQITGGLVKFGLGAEQAGSLIKGLSDEKGRFYIDFVSSGKLSKPKVKPDTQRLLNRLIQGAGAGLLDGLLKGLK